MMRGISFRTADPEKVRAAYAAMTVEEFDAINGRQAWANWRTIAQALKNVPSKPLACVDLACGTGMSTSVLAHYCPPGSSIIGYELCQAMIEVAERRSYRHHSGVCAAVEFRCQSITDMWLTPEEEPIPDASVDLVNASGVVGHHLTPETVQPLIAELSRVIVPETGVAILDVGPKLSKDTLQKQMSLAGFVLLGHYRSSWFDYGQVAFRLTKKFPLPTF